ncbi:type I restriction enzyme, S subunit [Ruminococcaceae bacterium YAD3003]|nr:type I restriction enzyme, S subunit [Ruminococcaceae bacterium YAD3003]
MRVKLGDVINKVVENVDRHNTDLEFYVGGEHIISESICIYDGGMLDSEKGKTLGYQFQFRFCKDDVLFMTKNPYLKKCAKVCFDGICSIATFVLRTKDENVVSQRFLPILLQTSSFWDYLEANKSGSVNYFITWKTLSAYEFDLPSIEKQHKIADLAWSIERTKLSYESLIKATDDLVKSQFIEMFGDPIENPLGIKKCELQEFISADCSISYGIVKTEDDVPDGVPVFRPVDIVNGRRPQLSELKKTSHEISDTYKRSILTGRDMLITVRANIADTLIVDDEFKGCNVGRGIVPIRTNEEVMSLDFLRAQIEYTTMKDHIKSFAKGVTLLGLNMADLRKIEFIIPNRDQQDAFVKIVKQSDKSKFELKKAISHLTILYKQIIRESLG